MQACFPNVEILVYDGHELHLRAFVFEAATNRECQRTTIGQGRLNMPTLMRIESELLRTLDDNLTIDDFARVKARKHTKCDVNRCTRLNQSYQKSK